MSQWMTYLIGAALATTAAPALAAEAVNINSADEDALADAITGVGDVRAAAIIDHREREGQFQAVEDLKAVDGIGPATLEDNRVVLGVVDD